MSEVTAKRILVVEDDAGVRTVLALQLRTRDYAVLTAADGADGFKALQAELPDCVVLDLMMPVLDGFGLLKRIRSVGRLAALPVIILTASEDDRNRLRSQTYQADAYLSKPYQLDELIETIERVTARRAES